MGILTYFSFGHVSVRVYAHKPHLDGHSCSKELRADLRCFGASLEAFEKGIVIQMRILSLLTEKNVVISLVQRDNWCNLCAVIVFL